jgi:hypothetical protein
MINELTCFKSDPSLIDVILTNKPEKCLDVLNFTCGLSDFHNMVCFQLDFNVPPSKTKWISYRSFNILTVMLFIKI